MKIGLEAERANLPNPTGVENYAAQLIKNLSVLDKKNEYILYFRTAPQQWFLELPKNFQIRVMPFPKFWTQVRLSWEMIVHPVDVLVILASALPFVHPKKSIVTVHDVAWKLFPDAFTKFMRRYLDWSAKLAVKGSAKILSVSESTKKDLEKFYNASPHKITVTHLGFDKNRFYPKKYEEVQAVLDKYNLVYQKYVLFVGTIQPRKNLERLLDAYQKLRKENHIEEKLAIFGGRGWLWEPIVKKIKNYGLDGSIKYFDYAPKEDLPAIIAGAKLLTLPALYEGFGLPPLEAMASGVPVVVSNISSMPEVVGEAGDLVDPNSVNSIAGGLLKVLLDSNLRRDMIVKGLEQAKRFSWENTARQTLEVMESLDKK
ncbi:MAG TPA: glycosyltransferase family 1 protein [Methylomirabilota bacterium]|jgi:glycosyltransferase involved in cell wall biosynthesis|nr:glycosyltransferase family 1 protein [Methylomirabilota bacterium]